MSEARDQKDRYTILHSNASQDILSFAESVKVGLESQQKKLSCAFFYDEEGSNLFEEICDTQEYYVTRAETEILKEYSTEIAALCNKETKVVELGSGSSLKTRLLLSAFTKRYEQVHYVPIDISDTMLQKSANKLLSEYPTLKITAISAEYTEGLRLLGQSNKDGKIAKGDHLYVWLGSSIGNFTTTSAIQFLKHCRENMQAKDSFLIGTDLVKDKKVLEAAYDDKTGITAKFNKNILLRINAELGGHFDLDKFAHKSVWNAKEERVEMHLVSTQKQTVKVDKVNLSVDFAEGETIHTENSHKYTISSIAAIAKGCGFAVEKQWMDSKKQFCLSLWKLVHE